MVEEVIRALNLLHVLRGVNSLGLKSLSVRDFTAYEFDLMLYMQDQLNEKRKNLAANQKKG